MRYVLYILTQKSVFVQEYRKHHQIYVFSNKVFDLDL
uniref:Uncharacterized protein n=1 Tax=Anguilla anguilla TaxID=7936 RepID=A0A0E9RVK3_ANGAN